MIIINIIIIITIIIITIIIIIATTTTTTTTSTTAAAAATTTTIITIICGRCSSFIGLRAGVPHHSSRVTRNAYCCFPCVLLMRYLLSSQK
jgi:hypothetical protein